MKRTLVLLLVTLLLAALGVVVLAQIPADSSAGAGLPAVARARLDEYLVTVYPPGSIRVQAAARATRARRFEETMSGRVFGSGVYYQSDLGPTWSELGNLLPLSYPPREVWCVRLGGDPDPAGGRVVFPALHMDLYNADWLVHEATPGEDPGRILDAVGCALPPE